MRDRLEARTTLAAMLAGAAWAVGCGGAIESAGSDEATGLEETPASDSADPPPREPSAPSPSTPLAATSCGESIQLRQSAVYPSYEYGRDGDVFSISPDGTHLLSFQGQYDDSSLLVDLSSGEASIVERVIYDRSPDWAFELTRLTYGGASLLDTSSPESDVLCERSVLAQFDRAGSTVIDARCESGHVIVRHTDVLAPDEPWEMDAGIACEAEADGAAFAVLPMGDGDVLLSLNDELFGVLDGFAKPLGLAHAPWYPGPGDLPAMSRPFAAAPGGEALAIANREDSGSREGTVTVVRYPSLEPIAEDIPVAWTFAYANTYTSGFGGMPLAWSGDGALLALPSEDGGLALRHACDGQVAAELPALPIGEATMGLTNLAFSPDGTRLVAKWLADGYVYPSSSGDGQIVVYEVVRE